MKFELYFSQLIDKYESQVSKLQFELTESKRESQVLKGQVNSSKQELQVLLSLIKMDERGYCWFTVVNSSVVKRSMHLKWVFRHI